MYDEMSDAMIIVKIEDWGVQNSECHHLQDPAEPNRDFRF